MFKKGEYFGSQCLLGSIGNGNEGSTAHDETIVNLRDEPVVCIVIQRALLDKLDQQGVENQRSDSVVGEEDESVVGRSLGRERLGTFDNEGKKKDVARRISVTHSVAPLGASREVERDTGNVAKLKKYENALQEMYFVDEMLQCFT